MATFAKLNVALTATAGQFVATIKNANTRLTTLAKKSKLASLSVGTLAKGFLAFAGIQAFLRIGKRVEDFNQAMASSVSIMGDLSKAMVDDMAAAARQVGVATKFSATEAAQAFFFLASAGLSAAASIKALPLVAKFAQAGNFDLALATDLLTDALSALGLASKDAQRNLMNLTRLSDVLIKANTLANASVEQFSKALTTKAGASLRQLGIEVEEGVAVLAAFADQGIKAELAGTALSIVLRDLQTKALLNAAAFREAGIAVFDSSGEFRKISEIIGEMEKKLAPLSDATRKQTLLTLGFTDKSIAAIAALLGTSEAISEYERKLKGASGTTESVSAKAVAPLTKALSRLVGVFDIVIGTIGAPLFKALAGVINGMIDAGKAVIDFAKSLSIVKGIVLATKAAYIGFAKLLKSGPFVALAVSIGVVVGALVALKVATLAAALAKTILLALLGPSGWVVLAGAIVIAGAAIVGWKEAVRDASGAADESFGAIRGMGQASGEATQASRDLEAALGAGGSAAGSSADGMNRAAAAANRMSSAMSQAASIAQSVETPTESFSRKLVDLSRLLALGVLSWDDYARAAKAARDELAKVAPSAAVAALDADARRLDGLVRLADKNFVEAAKRTAAARKKARAAEKTVEELKALKARGGETGTAEELDRLREEIVAAKKRAEQARARVKEAVAETDAAHAAETALGQAADEARRLAEETKRAAVAAGRAASEAAVRQAQAEETRKDLDRAEQLVQGLKTPFDKAIEDAKEVARLLNEGILSPDEAAALISQIRKRQELKRPKPPKEQRPEMFNFSDIDRRIQESALKGAGDEKKIQEKQLVEIKTTNEKLDKIIAQPGFKFAS